MTARLRSFEEFWPFYVAQHLSPINQRLHFVGTTLVFGSVLAGLVATPRWFVLAPIAGYGFAWLGHFLFEKNRPATFSHPFWSLRGDFRMYRLMLLGRMHREVVRARALFPSGSQATNP